MLIKGPVNRRRISGASNYVYTSFNSSSHVAVERLLFFALSVFLRYRAITHSGGTGMLFISVEFTCVLHREHDSMYQRA